MKILLVEDHRDLRKMMAEHLFDRGFVVDTLGTLDDARAALQTYRYSALIVDLGLPDGDGLSLVREVPVLVSGGVPILIVTARDALEDRLAGLDAGADGYLIKPFHLDELEARLRAILRRPVMREILKLSCGALSFDVASREVTVRDILMDVSPREADLLESLLRASGRVVVRDALEEQVYSLEAVTPNALEAAVSRLRRRLTDVGADVRIETRRGIGYQLVVSNVAEAGEQEQEPPSSPAQMAPTGVPSARVKSGADSCDAAGMRGSTNHGGLLT